VLAFFRGSYRYPEAVTVVVDQNLAELAAPLGSELRPRWRGRTHMVAAVVAVPAFVFMIYVANGAAARTGAAIYAAGVFAMFAVSSTFHRLVNTVRARRLWQRADHATIFAAIAGTATPLCLLAMPRSWGIPLLCVLWAGAIGGALLKSLAFEWRHAQKLGGLLYIGLGWSGLVALPFLWRNSGAPIAVGVVVGGALYTVGAIGFALERPRLRPAVFGYHEVWHLFTIAAATVHFIAIWAIVTASPHALAST
jgi:hemolysin III